MYGKINKVDIDYPPVGIRATNNRMNFLKRWFQRMLREVVLEDQASQTVERNRIPAFESSRHFQFNVYMASGGRVVEIIKHDYTTQSDRQNRLYVITNGQNFSEELDKIITMECLK